MKKQKEKTLAFLIFFISFSFCTVVYSAGYDFYVDASSTESSEDGTESRPWKTITAAIDHVENEGFRGKTVFIKKGNYPEAIVLENNISLFGEDRHETVIDGTGKDYALYFKDTTSTLNGLTLANASTNIEVGRYAKVTVDNCSIKDSGSNGIYVRKSNAKKKNMFVFRNSSVKDSGKRGIYIFKRRIEIESSEFSGNEEEGIDLHTSVEGKVAGNTIENNGESGIEMMNAGASLSVKSNRILSNRAQGLSIQFYSSRKGKTKVTRNTIRENHGYGIRYARYDRGKIKEKFRDFIKKCVKLSGNSISGNGDGDFGYL